MQYTKPMKASLKPLKKIIKKVLLRKITEVLK